MNAMKRHLDAIARDARENWDACATCGDSDHTTAEHASPLDAIAINPGDATCGCSSPHCQV